jgi:hypothetical protein
MMAKKEGLSKDDKRKRKKDETKKEHKDGWNSAYIEDDWNGDEIERKDNAVSQRQADASSDEEEEEDKI